MENGQQRLTDAPLTKRFNAPNNAGIICVAKRLEVRPFVWPVQTKYKKLVNVPAVAEGAGSSTTWAFIASLAVAIRRSMSTKGPSRHMIRCLSVNHDGCSPMGIPVAFKKA